MAELNASTKSNASTAEEMLEEADKPASAPDLYGNMKLASQSMLDMALLLSNASELVQIMKIGEQQEFYLAHASLLCASILLQILVGVGLLLIATSHEPKNSSDKHKSEMSLMNRLVMVGVFLITVLNVFISAFSFKNTANIKVEGSSVSYAKRY